jgi:hypothetical protein
MDISYNEIYDNIQGINELDDIEEQQNVNDIDDLRGVMPIKTTVNTDEILIGGKIDDDFLKNVEDWNETFNYGLSEFEKYTNDDFKDNINNHSNIIIHTDEDIDANYKYYLFESHIKSTFLNKSELKVFVVLFESYNDTLININDTIMPLYDFINITHIFEDNKHIESGYSELRNIPYTGNTIICYNEAEQKQFSIKNISIPILMRAISYFQQLEKDKDKELDKDQLVNDVIVNEYINHEKNTHVGIIRYLYNILKWALW